MTKLFQTLQWAPVEATVDLRKVSESIRKSCPCPQQMQLCSQGAQRSLGVTFGPRLLLSQAQATAVHRSPGFSFWLENDSLDHGLSRPVPFPTSDLALSASTSLLSLDLPELIPQTSAKQVFGKGNLSNI